MDALEVRTSIINHFFDNIDKFTIIDKSTFNEITYKFETSEIRHNLSDNSFKFYMLVKAEVEARDPDYFSQRVNTYMQYHERSILVCELQNDKFSMISADSDDSWISLQRISAVVPSSNSHSSMFTQEIKDVIATNLKLVYNKIPQSEEEHFQTLTVTDHILELSECLKVIEITKRIKAIGTVVNGANKWRVYFKFKDDLSGDA